jgi:peptide/nickel transport system permease protein
MVRYLLARLVWAVAMVLGLVLLSFVITHLLPGDPIDALVGNFPAPAAYVAQVRHDFGLDQPLAEQLWRYVVNLAQGNLGFSFLNRQPVLPLVLHRAGITLLLMVPALATAALLGVALAVWSTAHAGQPLDRVLTGASLVGYSIPVFWLAQLLIMVFAVWLGWLPAQGMYSSAAPQHGLAAAFDLLRHLILPALCITVFYLAVVARVARSSMLEMLHQDFILTARAKGVRQGAVLWRHVLRNGMIPVITVIGYNFGHSLTGAILTETVFAWPGLGGLFISSIGNRDYPVLAAIFLLAATVVVLANLVTDLLYAVADPRVRLAARQVRA